MSWEVSGLEFEKACIVDSSLQPCSVLRNVAGYILHAASLHVYGLLLQVGYRLGTARNAQHATWNLNKYTPSTLAYQYGDLIEYRVRRVHFVELEPMQKT